MHVYISVYGYAKQTSMEHQCLQWQQQASTALDDAQCQFAKQRCSGALDSGRILNVGWRPTAAPTEESGHQPVASAKIVFTPRIFSVSFSRSKL